MKTLRVIQFTDIHIDEDENFEVGGYSFKPFERFQKAFDHAQIKDDDLIVISGDLAAWGPVEEIYKRISSFLEKYPNEKLILTGNHDDSQMIGEYFQTKLINNKTDGKLNWNGWNIFYLDSATGEVTPSQLNWLKENWIEDKSFLFMHHPPHQMKSDWMDKNYPLINRDEVWELLENYKITPVFCGHYHNEDYVIKNGIELFLTMSTLYQITDGGERKSVLDKSGYREIFLSATGEIKTKHIIV